MVNNIFPWVKGNYEKSILGILLVLLIITSSYFLGSVDKGKELRDFGEKIKPSQTSTVKMDPIYDKDLGSYLIKKLFSYYQPLIDRAVFFSVAIKSTGPSIPEMNFECTEVISTEEGIFTATFKNSRTGKIYKAKVGEQVENLKVVSINWDAVILSGEDKQYTLNPPAVLMPFKLTGTMEMGSQAMLQNDSTKKTYFVKAGDEVERWKVLSISENAVIISRPDSGKYELRIGGELTRIKD